MAGVRDGLTEGGREIYVICMIQVLFDKIFTRLAREETAEAAGSDGDGDGG